MPTSLDYSKTYWCDFRSCPELYDSTLELLKATGLKSSVDDYGKTAITWEPTIPSLDLSGAKFREERNHQRLSLPEFIAFVLNRPKKVEVKLNKEYTAKFTATSFSVGCQTFPLSVIDELVKARNEVLGMQETGVLEPSYAFDGKSTLANLPPTTDGFIPITSGNIQRGDLLCHEDGRPWCWACGLAGDSVASLNGLVFRRP